MGLQWFLTGVIFLFGGPLQHGSDLGKFYAFSELFLCVGVIVGAQRLKKKLKENLIAPRLDI